MAPAIDPRVRWSLLEAYVGMIQLACWQREKPEDPALVCAIGLRETHLGRVPGYVVAPGLPLYMGRGDGGHGRGLFQVDDRGPWRHLIPPDGVDWPPYEQAQACCTVLAGARVELADFRGALTPWAWDQAVAARYNAALENVRWAVRMGRDPDQVTTGRNYGRDVLALRDGLRQSFPSTFPTPAEGVA